MLPRVPRLAATALCFALACAAALGCQKPATATPTLLEIVPGSGLDDREVRVVIRGEGFVVSQSTDFQAGDESVIDARFAVLLGDVRLDDVQWIDEQTLEATVPSGLLPGRYDLSLTGPRGQTARLSGAYTVVSLAQADVLVTGYRFDVLTTQRAFEPFNVRVTAVDEQGARVTTFNGDVTLSDLSGAVTPQRLGSFSEGQWSGAVEVRKPHVADALRVVDGKGREGTSATFDVIARPPSALALSGVPRVFSADDCVGPVTVALLDSEGFATTSDPPKQTSLLSDPPDVARFFSDAACSLAVSALTVQAPVAFFIRGSRPLDIDLMATAAGLAAARVRARVEAGAPAAVMFLTPPRTERVDGCSPEVVIALTDVQGNRVPAPASTTITLVAVPAAALTFFSDDGCSSQVSSVVIPPGMDQVTAHFRGSAAGTYQLHAQTGAASASQDAVVLPGTPLAQRSPPTARLHAPGAAILNTVFTLDASESTDQHTPSAALEVSFDFTGSDTAAPGTGGWTPWTTTKTASHTWQTEGSQTPVVAVRDTDGDISYATVTVRVLLAAAACVVTSDAPDDGAADCTVNLGPDGVLSFAEAVRLMNAQSGNFEIVPRAPLTVGAGTYTFTTSGYLLSERGVVFNGTTLTVDGNAQLRTVGVELTGATAGFRILSSATLSVEDAWLRDSGGVEHSGRRLELRRTRISGCPAAGCIAMTNVAQFLDVSGCDFVGNGFGVLLAFTDAGVTNSNSSIDFLQSVVRGFGTALLLNGGNTQGISVMNNTFHGNQTAVAVQSGNKLSFRNNIFSANTVAAFTGCTSGQFQTRDFHLLFQNASDGCIATDPAVSTGDPLFVDSSAGNFTLRQPSAAANTGGTVGFDLNGAGAGLFTGTAPDRGAVESW